LGFALLLVAEDTAGNTAGNISDTICYTTKDTGAGIDDRADDRTSSISDIVTGVKKATEELGLPLLLVSEDTASNTVGNISDTVGYTTKDAGAGVDDWADD
jgi:hypothetical protein